MLQITFVESVNLSIEMNRCCKISFVEQCYLETNDKQKLNFTLLILIPYNFIKVKIFYSQIDLIGRYKNYYNYTTDWKRF